MRVVITALHVGCAMERRLYTRLSSIKAIIESLIVLGTLGMQYNVRRHYSRNVVPDNDAPMILAAT